MNISSGLTLFDTMEEHLTKAKKGDKDAFVKLINAYKVSLYRVAKGILRQEEDIEDAFQDTIIKAYKGIVKLRNDEFFKSWLIRIMINECNAILKKRKKLVPLEDIELESADTICAMKNVEMIEIINTLEDELRVITILYYYEDIPQKDIARLLNIPPGTVRSRLSRAKEKLWLILK